MFLFLFWASEVVFLAVWLLERDCVVKDVNTALSFAQRKSTPMYQKSDSYDAEAVALALINMLDKLPDAMKKS